MEPEFYGGLDYKFKKLIGRNDFSFQFRKIIIRFKRKYGYNINLMRQSAWLAFNPITVDNYAFFYNCMPVDWASDSMLAPAFTFSWLGTHLLVCCLDHRGSTVLFWFFFQ